MVRRRNWRTFVVVGVVKVEGSEASVCARVCSLLTGRMLICAHTRLNVRQAGKREREPQLAG